MDRVWLDLKVRRIIGYVDGCFDDVVTGWVACLDEPSCLPTVFVRNAEGAALPFKPYMPRVDVCSAIGRQGLFGLAIPVAALRLLGPVISITDEAGTPLENGACITLAAPSPPPGWAMLHIQKTAGTSLRSALLRHFKQDEVAFVYPDRSMGLAWNELPSLPWVQRANLRMVMGHMVFGHADCLPGGAQYLAFLRDPLARVRSHYYHHLKHESRFVVDGEERSTREVLLGGLTDEFDNLMVRVIAGTAGGVVPAGGVGERHVAVALDNVRRCFRFVGLMERIGEHYPALCQVMGLPAASLPRENLGLKASGEAHVADDPIDWDVVARRHVFDRMLFDRLRHERLVGVDLRVVRALGSAAD